MHRRARRRRFGPESEPNQALIRVGMEIAKKAVGHVVILISCAPGSARRIASRAAGGTGKASGTRFEILDVTRWRNEFALSRFCTDVVLIQV